MDEQDLELVGRLRPEPTPDPVAVARHRHQLHAAIQATASPGPVVEADAGSDDGSRVVSLTGRGAGNGRGRSWRRTAVAVAAAVAVLGGVVAAVGLATDDDPTVTDDPGSPDSATQPAPPEEAPCGTELPIDFPTPPGFEGPFPGHSDRLAESRYMAPDISPGTVQLHWRSADATIDVRWPPFPPMDPTTPYIFEHTDASEGFYHEDEGRAREATFSTLALGAGQCAQLGMIVISDDPLVVERTFDQVQLALVGPGGLLPSPVAGPLVHESTEADALPEVMPCPGPTPWSGGPVDDAGTYPTPQEALAAFLATEPGLMQWQYEEIALPDGSFGYAHDGSAVLPGDREDIPDLPATGKVVTVVHVASRDVGWSVDYWQGSAC